MVPHELVMAEVDELANNKARRCSVCQRRARFWPTRPETLVRAASQGWSDRCEICVLAPDLFWSVLQNERPSTEFRRGVRHHQAEQVMLQIEGIEQLPPGAECAQALTMLYLQLQLLADELCNEGLRLRLLRGGKASSSWAPLEQPMQ